MGLSQSRSARRLYTLQDANFNLTAITDTGGNVAERYLFDPYGNRTILSLSWAVLSATVYAWVVGHQGLLHDPESGIVCNRNRFIHPLLGAFTRRDPLIATECDGEDICRDDFRWSNYSDEFYSTASTLAARVDKSSQTASGSYIDRQLFYDSLAQLYAYITFSERQQLILIGASVYLPVLNAYEYELSSPTRYVDSLGLIVDPPGQPRKKPRRWRR